MSPHVIIKRLGISITYWKYSAFCGHPRWEATWNDGILECWNTGYKKRKKIYSTKMLYHHFMMMPVRHPFSASAPENTPLLQENQYNYFRFDSLNPSFHYPRTHYSIIPEFHHSNWGEAPNLLKRCSLLYLVDCYRFGLFLLGFRHFHLQYAVLEFGLDLIRINIGRQSKRPLKFSIRPFSAIIIFLIDLIII